MLLRRMPRLTLRAARRKKERGENGTRNGADVVIIKVLEQGI